MSFFPLRDLYRRKGRLEEMEPIIQHGLEIQEKYLSRQDRGILNTLQILGALYQEEKKYSETKPIYERILAAEEKNNRPDDPVLLSTLNVYCPAPLA